MGWDEETKKKLKSSVETYLKKNAPKDPRRDKRRNLSPEKEFVKKLILHLKLKGFFVTVVEAKAVWNEKANRYLTSQVSSAGFCDIVGNDPEGRAVFIEAKAEGKRATIRENQYEFLKQKIESNCFAACVDSISFLDSLYSGFKHLQTVTERKQYLLNYLPKPRKKKYDPGMEFQLDTIDEN